MKKYISKIIKSLNLDTKKEVLMIKLGLRKQVFEQRASEIKKMYQGILKPGMLVFDIGANQGHYTSAFVQLSAEVVSVEPQKNCFDILSVRYKNHPKVHLVNTALDYEQGEKKMHVSNMNTISSMSEDWIAAVKDSKRFPGAEWSKETTVKTTTLESLIQLYGKPDFIKIDVEGYELNVLKGLKSKVPLISIEYTFEIIESTVKCLEYMESLGKTIVLWGEVNSFNDESKWISNFEAIKLLRQLKENEAGDLFIKFVS